MPTSILKVVAVLLLLLLVIGLGLAWHRYDQARLADPIRVGILHSLTGTMAISERGVVTATRLAIDEINAAGGLLGRPLQTIVRNGASDWATFAREAESLILDAQVDVVFGCWTSASRKTVKPVFEQYDHLLFYPVQYEGLELSPNIVYTGAAPNQQIIPAVKWAMDNLGRRFFLVGSDYVFPHAANAIMRDQIRSLRGSVVGEHYVLLGSTEVESVVEAIATSRPDVILNTLNGDSNVAFFKALRARGLTPDRIPTISFSIAEAELKIMGSADFAGDYAAWNYFQSLPGESNRRFVAAYQAQYGANQVVTDPMEAAYLGVYLWAEAVKRSGRTDPVAVRRALPGLSIATPGGAVSLDGQSQHLWKSVRIGKIQADGQFEIVWDSVKPVRPLPYPGYRSPAEWEAFLTGLNQRWQGQWTNPGTEPTPPGQPFTGAHP
ncbi:urea ABC transporter substrate-binding protein [Allochromatium palmeri]|uniref:Urea ABC transporter substrate-binding protein n=1 Tax=Allochromatium palmeri TaxID=231048 RepID=A0A6N8EFW9_9GAMM|nr:urea ABC transporter substrate-binding protein [Allochromatium palmeri]MTW23135.1 urea ABC transporter substrate-binding protein [Allochromatium palmeri]